MNVVDNRKIYDEHWGEWLDMKRLGPASRWLRTLIADHVKTIRGSGDEIANILDVGCGEGTITAELAVLFPQAKVRGIDFSKTGIDCARASYRKPNLEFQHDVDSNALTERYDMVTAFEVLEHADDWEGLLGRMTDASRRYVMMSFPLGRMRSFEVHVGHLRNFRRGQVEHFMAQRDFTPVHVFQAGFPFYSPLYREACNVTDSASNRFTTGKYGVSQKLVATFIYALFRYASSKRHLGDQFCGLFRRREQV
jgi:SAM-dependent methyltransferase